MVVGIEWPLSNIGIEGLFIHQKATQVFPQGPVPLAWGNVWEWCRDRYAPDYFQHLTEQNPKGPLQSAARGLLVVNQVPDQPISSCFQS